MGEGQPLVTGRAMKLFKSWYAYIGISVTAPGNGRDTYRLTVKGKAIRKRGKFRIFKIMPVTEDGQSRSQHTCTSCSIETDQHL